MRRIVRKYLFHIVAFIIFYSGALSLLRGFINCFKISRNEDGEPRFPYLARRACRNVQILAYHRVNDDLDPFFAGISIDAFKLEMEFLVSHCNILSLEDAVYRLKHSDVPDNAVVVTFDDGYKDNFLNAFPILKLLSIPASIFLATDVVGSGRALWHDRLFSAFRETKVLWLNGIANDSRRYSLKSLENKLSAQQAVLKLLWALDDDERLFWIDRLTVELEVFDRREMPELMLNWDEIRIMQQHNIAFGSHSVTHPILSRISAERIRTEIQRSKETIEKQLNVPVRTFAYPVGRSQDFNEDTKTLLQEDGYICAVTTIPGANESGQDPFELRRVIPWESYLPAFAAKLNWYRFC
jgi:peptidoglycan/xylan/chitin deacetylase (PgdA/CDA1 family)